MLNTEQAPDGSIALTDSSGEYTAHLRLATGGPGWCAVELFDGDTGKALATPVRLHITDSGGKIAADFPGCDANLVVVDGQGHIING